MQPRSNSPLKNTEARSKDSVREHSTAATGCARYLPQRADSRRRLSIVAAVIFCGSSIVAAQERVVDTVHNLSVTGPGEIRAETEEQVCIFCHAPHGTGGAVPLWNRDFSVASYRIYQSSTFDAAPGQPTGTSKLCLSCHDGTIALGRVLSRVDQIRMVGGDFIPAGLTNLGTDLSDDHPISFYYTAGLAASDGQLVSPAILPPEIKLDPEGQLQCTACHDAHHDRYRMFLVMSDEFGALCTACHDMDGWLTGSHRNSTAAVTGALLNDWPFDTVEENACRGCHRSHTAGGRERLLIYEREEDNCLNCHDGRVARFNILAEIDKPGAPDPRLYLGIHDPAETLAGAQPHVECVDCHNPHAAEEATEQGYVPIGATMLRVPGVTTGGTYVKEARFEYEVCYRCHGDTPVPIPNRIVRQADQPNMRLRFSPNNPSFHSVVQASPGEDTVSLDPSIPSGSLMRCTDCHNNDSGPRAGGNGPDGPHGSIYDFLLERNYTITDNTPESAYDYASCYECHRRASILENESFPEHSRHLQIANATCSVCHDAHGVSPSASSNSDHTQLMNFDISIVRPLTTTGELFFRDLGRFAGSCTLICHNRIHINQTYGN